MEKWLYRQKTGYSRGYLSLYHHFRADNIDIRGGRNWWIKGYLNSSSYLYIRVRSSIIHNNQRVMAMAVQMSINRWMDKQNWSIYIMEYNSAIKRNKVLKHAIAKSILKTCCVKEAFLPFSFSFSFSPFAGGPSHYIYGSPGHIQGPLVGVPTDSSISHQTCKRNKD